VLKLYSGKPVELNHLNSTPAQLGQLFVRVLELQGEGGGLYAEALKTALIFDVVSSKSRPGEDAAELSRYNCQPAGESCDAKKT